MSTALDTTELAFAGAARQARLIADGEITSRELAELYLGRIERLDPKLNAFRIVRPIDVLAQADAADGRRAAGEGGALNGVPIAIKDDVDVAGEVTAWGTAAHGPVVATDADVTRALRDAGAVLLGKTHVPEMTICCFTETETFGATRNPWDPERTPGGSSGGTAAAVAAGLCGIGLGSDGAGSIRIPAAWCGLFGLKPQRDRVPIAPHDDAWNGMSVNGPIARTVADAALFLDVTSQLPCPPGGFVAALETEPEPMRIAVATNLPPGLLARVSEPARNAVRETADLLRALGHDVVERDLDYGPKAGTNVFVRYLNGIACDVATLAHPERLDRRTRGFARAGAALGPFVARARRDEAEIAARIGAIYDGVDVVLTPGPAQGPFGVGALDGRGWFWTANAMAARVPFYGVFNATGQPAASVPAGFDSGGLPLAVQLVGRPHDEVTLLRLSAQLEAARPWAGRRPPVS